FNNSGISEGDILLMTDGIAKTVQEQIRKLDLGRFRLSILSVGTREGAPIPLQGGGFIKDQEGSIVIARTDSSSLSSLARQRGGIHRTLTINDKDLNDLQQLWLRDFLSAKHQQTEFKSDRWQEQGPWLLLLLTPLAAWVFRRGILLPVMVVILFLPIHNEGYASDTIWDRLWHNNNQRALQAFESGDHQQAAQLFEAPDWKASALYEAGDYAQALEQWQQTDSDESWYNRGNSLARLGRYQEALTSYDQALKINAEHEDALFNRKLIEQALTQQREQQPKNPNQQQDSKDSQDRHKQDERQESSGNNSAGQNSQQDQAESKNKSDANSTQDNANSQPNAESNSSGERDIQDKQPTPTQEPSTAMDSIQNNDDPEQSEASQQQPNQQAEHKDQQGDALDLNERQDHSMSEQVEAQWLRRIPDDPGGLLRNKFRYLYSQQPNSRQEAEPW
nr:tetratricopeptide repeat protein [Gammaproteobacteria bacterium]